jgi:hypothetical protein
MCFEQGRRESQSGGAVGAGDLMCDHDVTLISANGLEPNLQLIMDGGVQDADMSFPPNDYIGWLSVHSVLAALSGTPGENQNLPMRLIDETNIEDGNLTTLFPTYDGFQEAFKEAWGLS